MKLNLLPLMAALTAEARKDEAGTRALWETEKNNYLDVRARQILISFKGAQTEPGGKANPRSEAQAKALALALRDKLRSGADFAALAKAQSDDASTRKQGGELPPFTRGAMQAEFEMAAFTLQTGTVSEPVKTKYGYHLIEVLERQPFAFDRLRPTLEYLRAQRQFEAIAASPVQLDDGYFKP